MPRLISQPIETQTVHMQTSARPTAHSCPEKSNFLVDSMALFDVSESNTLDDESVPCEYDDTTQEDSSGAYDYRRKCKNENDFREFFSFLDDAHTLGYCVEDAKRNGKSKLKKTVSLSQPSHEKYTQNSKILAMRAAQYCKK